MPGKDSDLPSRKERKIIGKKNVKGRMGGGLPLYDLTSSMRGAEPDSGAERDVTYPEVDQKPGSIGHMF